MTIFKYNFVSSSEEHGVLTVGFADSQFNTQNYLLFQSSIDADESEDNNEIYVERNGQQYGVYGGVEKFILSRNEAHLALTRETAKHLDTEREVVVIFFATDKQFLQLKVDLNRVFSGNVDFEIK